MYNSEYKKNFSIQLQFFYIQFIKSLVQVCTADTWQLTILQKPKQYFLLICCIFQNRCCWSSCHKNLWYLNVYTYISNMICKQDFALNNLQWLIFYKTKTKLNLNCTYSIISVGRIRCIASRYFCHWTLNYAFRQVRAST